METPEEIGGYSIYDLWYSFWEYFTVTDMAHLLDRIGHEAAVISWLHMSNTFLLHRSEFKSARCLLQKNRWGKST